MAYVQIPKDMTEVQSRLVLNLTKRQVVCFGAAAVIGIPVYISANSLFGSQAAMMLMIVTTLPAFFFALYKRSGLPAEKYLLVVLRQKYFYPQHRKKVGIKKGGVKVGAKPVKPKKADPADPADAAAKDKTVTLCCLNTTINRSRFNFKRFSDNVVARNMIFFCGYGRQFLNALHQPWL